LTLTANKEYCADKYLIGISKINKIRMIVFPFIL
jgi:hypothetical protein